ncbi:MAG: dipeptide/oligopeptide/nickel ABC transporter permease/ATP-binding protein [Treponema sp.]|jgi:peptide/nickel transport system permease protein|nr:dipeptide/oligopeptide/nickel ABC transporter permease/ATP-binding protein [Treponema sp.]
MKKFYRYLKSRPLGMGSLAVVIVLYVIMAFAEFIAPYSPGTAFSTMSYHPPNLRFSSGFKAQEARVINTVNFKYVRIRDFYHTVAFFGRGEPYKLFGVIPLERHLFTTGVYDDSGSGYPLFLMGADGLGRDLFSRIVYGSRISLTIGFIATFISLLLALFFGGLGGYRGGAVDWGIMRFAELFMLIPGLYLILFLRSLLSSSMDSGQTYMMITVILSLVGWPGSARTIRGMVHSIKREEFVQNAQNEMIPPPVILASHIIPQMASLLIVSVALSIPGFIMTETTLSYLGLGITDPAVSWGSLIRRDITTLNNLRSFPWLLNPLFFLLAVTLAFNFLGDCLRDFYDPYHTVFRRRKKNAKNAVDEGETQTAFPLLDVKNLAVQFSILRGNNSLTIQAVRGVSFRLERGEVLGIVGESGSGKSVSTAAIPGLLPANASCSGSVYYEGKNILGDTLINYRGKKIGMIFQEPGRSFDPLQNMGKVFLETLRNSDRSITKKAALERARALLEEAGLDNPGERLSNFPHQFSGGQLQRAGIALAIAQGCELLIADEPTTALDVTIQKQIMELLKSLQKSRALSIIFISHDIDLVTGISNRILVMYGGLVMESGSTAHIVSSARHPYTKALLESSPEFGSHYTRGRIASIPGRMSDPADPEAGCPFAPRCTFAKPECGRQIPPLVKTGGGELRCIMAEDV